MFEGKATTVAKKSTIDCPIFKEKEWIIEQLTRDLNSAKDPRDKAACAKLLLKEVKRLLECEKKDTKSPECEACQLLAKTRTEMANLIIRVSKLRGVD